MDHTRTSNRPIGSPVERLEDLRFLRGRGEYVDDMPSADALHAVILRSAVATPLEGGQVILLRGRQSIRNVGELIRAQSAGMQTQLARPPVGENVPRAVLDKLRSGDLVVFGGDSRYVYHGVTKILPGTGSTNLGLAHGRLNITLRVTGLSK